MTAVCSARFFSFFFFLFSLNLDVASMNVWIFSFSSCWCWINLKWGTNIFEWNFFICCWLATWGWVKGEMTQLLGDLIFLLSLHFTSNSLVFIRLFPCSYHFALALKAVSELYFSLSRFKSWLVLFIIHILFFITIQGACLFLKFMHFIQNTLQVNYLSSECNFELYTQPSMYSNFLLL